MVSVIIYSRADPLMDRGGPDRASRGAVPPRVSRLTGAALVKRCGRLVALIKTSHRPGQRDEPVSTGRPRVPQPEPDFLIFGTVLFGKHLS